MFSWSKKKETKRRERPEQDSDVNEFGIKLDKGPNDKELEAELKGLTGVSSLPEDDFSLNEGEDDVETELQRLIGGGKGKRQLIKPPNKDESIGDISQLIADIDLGDEDVEIDENDEELLGELLELTNPEEADAVEQNGDSDSGAECEDNSSTGDSDILKILKERLKLYKTAEEKAKENNESTRARRFARGIKTLEDLLKKSKQGKAVSPGDIPPVIALNLKPAPPPSAPSENGDEETVDLERADVPNPTPSETVDVMTTLKERLQLYHTAEAKAKESGETTRARRFARGIKTLESLIKQVQAGKEISPDDIPPIVPLNLKPAPPVPIEPPETEEEVEDETENIPDEPEEHVSQQEEKNIDEVLSERLKMYKTAEEKAKKSGETTRASRFARGIKTLQNLIKQSSAGKPINPEDIPPKIALNLKPAPSVPIEPPEPEEEVEDETENIPDEPEEHVSQQEEKNIDEVLSERLKMYKTAEEKAKKSGETTRASRFARGIKTLQNLIKQSSAGKPINPEDIPPKIALNLKPAPPIVLNMEENQPELSIERENSVRSSDIPHAPLSFAAVDDVDIDELVEEDTPSTVLEGLEQRVRFYSKCQVKAKQDGDLALADQNGRIVKVYMNAISTLKKGGYVDVFNLPNPKNCPPIPMFFYVL